MSSTNICSDVYGDYAINITDYALGQLIPLALNAYTLATEQTAALTNFTYAFHTWDASFTADGVMSGFNRPTRPETPVITAPDLTGEVPDVPTITVRQLVLENAPAEPSILSNIPTFLTPVLPAALDAERPGAAPTLDLDDRPVAPTIDEPAAPDLLDVSALIPDAPSISVTEFAEEAPEFDAPVPSETVNFTEEAYTSDLMDTLRTQYNRWIDDGGLLPQAVATALWDRAVGRDDASALKLRQEAREGFAARGFEEPNGILARRQVEIDLANRTSRNNINRDVYIQDQTVAVENLKWAVQQGLQLETTLLSAHMTVQQRRLDMALKSKDVAIAVFNAHVARYNALIQAYNARIDAYKAFLDGLRAEVDIYRAQVEAAKIAGDINEQRVRLYAEQVRAQLTRAEMYRAQIEGFKAHVDAERARIEGYRAEVDAYRVQVEAHGTEVDAYRSQIQAEAEKGKLFETMANIYGTRVDVWRTKGQTAIAEQQANLASQEAYFRQHEGQVRALLARLQAAETLIRAQAAQADATARMYEADVRLEDTAVNADTRAFQATTERARARSDQANRDAELQIQQLIQASTLALRAMESAGQSSSQLAASSLSALNFSAGVSSSQSRQKNCSTSFNYSGEPADAGV